MMRRKYRRKNIFFTCFPLFLLFTGMLFFFLDQRLLPPLKEISHMQCKAVTNELIDKAVFSNLNKLNSSAILQENDGSFQANTAQINAFCASLSKDITNEFSFLPKEAVLIPAGAATGLSILANTGPLIPFTLIPMGAVTVDYETSFSAAGINQINYKIWLLISMEMKIVNPLYQETIQMERKIMLADLIFSGKVPEHYFQISTPSEYLLTE